MANEPTPSRAELQQACLEWAEYLYDLYQLHKHKQLHLPSQDKRIKARKRGKR